MESLLVYLFQSAVWLTGFSLVYLLFLRNERYFVLKRIFLLAGLISALVFPLFKIHYNIELHVLNTNLPSISNSQTIVQEMVTTENLLSFSDILPVIYLTGLVLFIAKTIIQTSRLINKIKKETINEWGSARVIRTSDYNTPFSFFTYVFINPSVSEIETEEIMHHELVHINQVHWFDLLLVELICLLQWVNPFAWIYTRLIRLNHEYLADETALQRTSDPAIYRAALLNQMFNAPVFILTNSFNYSLNKKRFEMMKKIDYSPWRKIKVFLILPVFALIIYSFAKPEYKYLPVESTQPIESVQPDLLVVEKTATEILNTVSPIIPESVQSSEIVTDNQQITGKVLTGIVLQEDGKPLEGANIIIGGSTIGTSSDSEGKFTLGSVKDNSTVIISFIGYQSLAIKPDFTSEMKLTMVKKAINLGEGIQVRMTDDTEANPIYIIDGVIKIGFDMKNLEPSSIISVAVLKGEGAIEKYGEIAKDGAIEIITSKSNFSENVNNSNDLAVVGYGQPLTNIKFIAVEKMPEFPGGGREAMNIWISENLKYPIELEKNNISGEVIVNFIVTSAGKIKDVVVLKSVHPLLDAEAIRVVSRMPDWNPGMQNGKTVDVAYSIPISFKRD